MNAIVYDFEVPHPPERVWALLTDSTAMAKWLMPNDFAPKLGHRFTFRREPMPALGFDGVTRCEVTALNPPKHLAFTFVGGALDTLITFKLAPTATGTRIHFEHSGFDEKDQRQVFSFEMMKKGWGALGQHLEKLLVAD